MKKIFFLMMATLLVFAGCEKVIDFQADEVRSQVVVYSLPDDASPVSLRLTYSRFFLDDRPFQVIDNALVTLKVNGVPASATYADGYYNFGCIPQEGDQLDLLVQVPGRESVSAHTAVPHKAKLSNASCSLVHNEGEYYSHATIRFTLDDPANEENYYMLAVFIDDSLWQDTTINTYYDWDLGRNVSDTTLPHWRQITGTVNFTINDPMIATMQLSDLERLMDGGTIRELYFTDEMIDGKSHEVVLNVPDYYDGEYGQEDQRIKNIRVVVTSMSRDRYLFERSAGTDDDWDELTGIFSEPMQVHCNINGGIGIFGAASYSQCTIKM